MTKESVFRTLVRTSVSDISTQLDHANRVRGRARTGYYRVCFFLLASLVELIVYRIVEKKLESDPSAIT